MNQPPDKQTLRDDQLLAAASRFDAKGVAEALALGANADARQALPDGAIGPTALMRACERPHGEAVECVRLLLEAGADPNASTIGGDTAALWAAGQRNARGIELLSLAGADLNAASRDGRRIEDFSTASGSPDFVAWLASYALAWRERRELARSPPAARAGRGLSL